MRESCSFLKTPQPFTIHEMTLFGLPTIRRFLANVLWPCILNGEGLVAASENGP
jgi:hypothetical protein